MVPTHNCKLVGGNTLTIAAASVDNDDDDRDNHICDLGETGLAMVKGCVGDKAKHYLSSKQYGKLLSLKMEFTLIVIMFIHFLFHFLSFPMHTGGHKKKQKTFICI